MSVKKVKTVALDMLQQMWVIIFGLLSILNKSGFKGVTPIKKKWRATIVVDNKSIYIGSYSTKEEAAKAYDKAAKECFGEFARTNF